MRRYPDFVTYFGTPVQWAFHPFAFWLLPVMLPPSVAAFVREHQNIWVRA